MTPQCWICREVSTPLWWIHLEVDFLVLLEQASVQVYEETFMWQIDQGVKTPQCIHHRGILTLLTPWCILHHEVLLQTNLGRFPSDEYTSTPESHDSSLVNIMGNLNPSGVYTGGPIMNTNNSSNIQKMLKTFLGMSDGTWICLMKNQSKKILWNCPFKKTIIKKYK